MLGSSLTFYLDGAGGTAKVLPLINQDGYSSEYYLDEATDTWRAKIRHSRDNVKAGSQAFDRHTVTITWFIKPSTDYPNGSTSEVIFTIRNDPNGNVSWITDVSEALSHYMVKAGGIAPKLMGWES